MNHLILTIAIMLCLASCKKEEMPPEELSWAGDWVASMVLRDGVLTEIPIGTNSDYIMITIEEGDNAYLVGNTFKNKFGIKFEVFDRNKVEFGMTIQGTRVQEEIWGGAFLDNILKTKSYNINKEYLHFKNIDEKTLITFTKP